MRTILVLLLGCLFWVPAAQAWNANGHRITARIAYDELEPALRNRVGDILRAHPRFREDFLAAMPVEVRRGTQQEQTLWIFERASIWPDLVPHISDAVRERFHRGTWHYINLPAYLTAQDADTLEGRLEHNMHLEFQPPLREGLNIIQALEGNLRMWQDAAAADADKAVALCWILHLAGDLHQPLHTVALFSEDYFPLGDRGGNSIRIAQEPQPGNLHAVWDNLPDGIDHWYATRETQDVLAGEVVTQDAPAHWLQEHFQLALRLVYTAPLKSDLLLQLAADPDGTIHLPDRYREVARAAAKEQVIAAGHRIAALLAL